MDFTWTAEEEAFRQEIQAFLQAELPGGWGSTQFWDPDDDSQFAFAHAFTKKLGQKNWLAVSWPQAYGGLDWPFWQQFILNEELANCDAPVVGRNATRFLGPTIMRYGTDEQKKQQRSTLRMRVSHGPGCSVSSIVAGIWPPPRCPTSAQASKAQPRPGGMCAC